MSMTRDIVRGWHNPEVGGPSTTNNNAIPTWDGYDGSRLADSDVLLATHIESGSIHNLQEFIASRTSPTENDLWLLNNAGAISIRYRLGGTTYQAAMTAV